MPSYEPVVPQGQHLGTSHEVDGAVVGHLFDDETNKLQGHAAWREVDEPEYDYSSRDDDHDYEPPRQLTQEEIEQIAELAALIIVGIVKAVVVASPHVKRWWEERVIPTAKSVWKRISKPRGAKREAEPTSRASVSRPTFVASPTGVEIAVAESKITMSSAEWQARFRAMLAAGAFQEKQRKILSSARIEDDSNVLESRETAEQLTPQQFADRIKLMLEANPSLLNDSTVSELVRVFSARSEPSGEGNEQHLELLRHSSEDGSSASINE
jgi:hypothetical protein